MRSLCFALLSVVVLVTGCKPSNPKMVFAHYMVCNVPPGAGGATVENYKAEIREAQKRGIDGFALNCGGWTAKEPHYKARVVQMYEAAKQLDSGFRLMISADFCTQLTLEEAKDMVETFREHPNQLRRDGKPVLSTWVGGKETTEYVRSEFTGDRSIFFVPFYFPNPAQEIPSNAAINQVYGDNLEVDGFFFFGAAGKPSDISDATRRIAKKWKDAGKLFMAPVTPYYRGPGGNYRCFESRGFEGMAGQWEAAIQSGADWVEIVTWNDWGECTYLSPFGSPEETLALGGHYGKMLSHAGFLDASRYYIDWFKTGKKPPVTRDAIYYFYRLHPKSIAGYIDVREGRDPKLPERGRPEGAPGLEDSIYATVFLVKPAVLEIREEGDVREFPLPAGVHHVSAPMRPGPPRFQLKRDGKVVIDKTGEFAVSGGNAWGNYNYFSGSAEAPGN